MGTAASADDHVYGAYSSRLVDGKGLDGVWVYQENGGTVCGQAPGAADTVRWFSLELEVPHIVTKVQLAKRMDCCEHQGPNSIEEKNWLQFWLEKQLDIPF